MIGACFRLMFCSKLSNGERNSHKTTGGGLKFTGRWVGACLPGLRRDHDTPTPLSFLCRLLFACCRVHLLPFALYPAGALSTLLSSCVLRFFRQTATVVVRCCSAWRKACVRVSSTLYLARLERDVNFFAVCPVRSGFVSNMHPFGARNSASPL